MVQPAISELVEGSYSLPNIQTQAGPNPTRKLQTDCTNLQSVQANGENDHKKATMAFGTEQVVLFTPVWLK